MAKLYPRLQQGYAAGNYVGRFIRIKSICVRIWTRKIASVPTPQQGVTTNVKAIIYLDKQALTDTGQIPSTFDNYRGVNDRTCYNEVQQLLHIQVQPTHNANNSSQLRPVFSGVGSKRRCWQGDMVWGPWTYNDWERMRRTMEQIPLTMTFMNQANIS